MKKLNIILSVLSMILLSVGSAILGTSSFLTSPTQDGDVNLVSTIPSVEPKDDPAEEITYTYKTYEDYFVDYFNVPSELYTRDESTKVVTINYSGITRKSQNGEIELSYNNEVFYTVTSADLTGAGTESDPYIVNSTKGFLYLTNNLISKLQIASKYIELTTNIILNDETFDENGNPSGGDGDVYLWESVVNGAKLSIDGKGFSIEGLYIIASENYKGLFGSPVLELCQNLNFENIYLSSTAYGLFALSNGCNYLKNCNVLSGFIKGKENVMALVLKATEIVNSNNYVDVYASKGTASGMVFTFSKRIANCNNYGNITSEGNTLGGLVSHDGLNDVIIENCKNFGNITGHNYVGGIISCNYRYDRNITIKNCSNYGKIHGNALFGGILGYSCSLCNIIGCENYGTIKTAGGYSGGGIVGYIYDNYRTGIVQVNIINCKNVVDDAESIACFVGNIEHKVNLNISNCVIDVSNYKAGAIVISSILGDVTSVNVKDVKVILKNNTQSKIYFSKGNNNNLGKINIKNVIIENDFKSSEFILFTRIQKELLDVHSCMLVNKSAGEYYGSDFSGYYVSWRTGKIGLVALDGRGFFQGKIDEEWLKNNGYTKKAV